MSELLRLHATAPIPDIREHKSFSSGLALIVKKLMAKDPVDRYQSADALQADLNQVNEITLRAEASESFRLGCLDRRFRTTRYQVASPAYVNALQS